MSEVWAKIQECADTMKSIMGTAGHPYHDPILDKYSWENHLYKSHDFRRGHVEVVDKRDSHGLLILHATIFPHINDASPIWGFDAVCGKNKITGAFHDFSIVEEDHPMYLWFKDRTKNITWKKERVLPEWAQNIFSPSMIAAGNISAGEELDSIVELGIESLKYYVENVGKTRYDNKAFYQEQDYYCINQKLNPHVVRSMVAMGFEQAVIESFVDEVLFPEIGK
jgi:hypothetical protein